MWTQVGLGRTIPTSKMMVMLLYAVPLLVVQGGAAQTIGGEGGGKNTLEIKWPEEITQLQPIQFYDCLYNYYFCTDHYGSWPENKEVCYKQYDICEKAIRNKGVVIRGTVRDLPSGNSIESNSEYVLVPSSNKPNPNDESGSLSSGIEGSNAPNKPESSQSINQSENSYNDTESTNASNANGVVGDDNLVPSNANEFDGQSNESTTKATSSNKEPTDTDFTVTSGTINESSNNGDNITSEGDDFDFGDGTNSDGDDFDFGDGTNSDGDDFFSNATGEINIPLNGAGILTDGSESTDGIDNVSINTDNDSATATTPSNESNVSSSTDPYQSSTERVTEITSQTASEESQTDSTTTAATTDYSVVTSSTQESTDSSETPSSAQESTDSSKATSSTQTDTDSSVVTSSTQESIVSSVATSFTQDTSDSSIATASAQESTESSVVASSSEENTDSSVTTSFTPESTDSSLVTSSTQESTDSSLVTSSTQESTDSSVVTSSTQASTDSSSTPTTTESNSSSVENDSITSSTESSTEAVNEVETTVTTNVTEAPPASGPQSCSDVQKTNTSASSGVYTLFLDGKSKEVFCEMKDGDGWTLLQRRGEFENEENYFYRNWQEYRDGFGELEGEHWIGLEAMFELTNQEKKVDLRFM